MPARNLRAAARPSLRPALVAVTALAPMAALLALAGCWGGEDDPVSLLDRHSPAYTEPKGTRHAGDYMPLAADEAVPLQGSMKVTMRMTASGTSQGMPVSMDTIMVSEATLSADVRTLAARAVQLARGAVEAFPQEVTTRTYGDELLGEVETETLTSFYQKTMDAVNLVAVSGPDGILVESAKPLYMKIPLVVGESWDSQAADVPDLSEDGVAVSMQTRSRTFVVGKEKVGAGEAARDAVRLEQVTELSGTARAENGSSMGMNGQLQVALHFAEGVGQIRQKMIGRITMSGSAVQGGDRIDMKMTMDMEGDMELATMTMKRGHAGPEGAASSANASAPAAGPSEADGGGVESTAKAFAGAALRGILSVAP